MPGTLVIILAACATVFLAAVVAGLLLPLRASLNLHLLGDELKSDGMVAWGTPWLFSVVLADVRSAPRFRVMGFRLKPRDADDSAGESSAEPPRGDSSESDRRAEPVRRGVELSTAAQGTEERPAGESAPRPVSAPPVVDNAHTDRASPPQAPHAVPRARTRKNPAARQLKRGIFGLRRRWHRLRMKSKRDLAWRLLRQSGLRDKLLLWALRGARMLLRLVAFDLLKVHARVGLDDPSAMGRLFGYWKAIEYGLGLPQKRSFDLSLAPFFDRGEFLEVEGTVQIRTSAARLLAPMAVWLFTFPYITALRFAWSESSPREKRAAAGGPGVFAW